MKNRGGKYEQDRRLDRSKADDKVTSWARTRKKYFFLRVWAATQGAYRKTFCALLSGIRSPDMIQHNPKIFFLEMNMFFV